MKINVKGTIARGSMRPKKIITTDENGRTKNFMFFKIFSPKNEKENDIVTVILPDSDDGQKMWEKVSEGQFVEVEGSVTFSAKRNPSNEEMPYENITVRAYNVRHFDRPFFEVVPNQIKSFDTEELASILSVTSEPSEVLQMMAAAYEKKSKSYFERGKTVEDRREDNSPKNPMISK